MITALAVSPLTDESLAISAISNVRNIDLPLGLCNWYAFHPFVLVKLRCRLTDTENAINPVACFCECRPSTIWSARTISSISTPLTSNAIRYRVSNVGSHSSALSYSKFRMMDCFQGWKLGICCPCPHRAFYDISPTSRPEGLTLVSSQPELEAALISICVADITLAGIQCILLWKSRSEFKQ